MQTYDLIIVGGGAAGMLCAIEAKKLAMNKVLLIEKDNELGGALSLGNYNISNELKITGKYYKKYLIEEFEKFDIETKLNTMVLKIEEDNSVCSGIYTVGMAKKIFSMDMIPGRKILIDGSDTLYMIEKELKRSNIDVVGIISNSEDIETYDLTKDIYVNYEIKNIEGKGRVESVIIGKEDEEVQIECDTVLFARPQLSDGLVAMRSGIKLNPKTTGPQVNEDYMTSKENVYACGNGIYIHNYIEEIEKECSELIYKICR